LKILYKCGLFVLCGVWVKKYWFIASLTRWILKHWCITTKPMAKLKLKEHRGISTAAMVYNDLPLIDYFRRLNENTLLGCMVSFLPEKDFFSNLQ
jgi:hypothetical protein